jgi:pilus assembly protein CpaF
MNGFELILPFLRPIEPLILDPCVSEIMVNGSERIFIERAGFVEPVPGLTLTEKSLMIAVKNIARRLGADVSEANPILDSRLPDGSRVAAVIPPCSVHGITLTIRKFNARHFTVEDLIQIGTLPRGLAGHLKMAVIDRRNILISGGTGTGKTTLLNILAGFIPDEERVVLIEDTAEIQIEKPLCATAPTGSSWAKFGAARLSTCCSYSTRVIPAPSQRFMRPRPPWVWPGLPAASCRAASSCLTAPSSRTLPIR